MKTVKFFGWGRNFSCFFSRTAYAGWRASGNHSPGASPRGRPLRILRQLFRILYIRERTERAVIALVPSLTSLSKRVQLVSLSVCTSLAISFSLCRLFFLRLSLCVSLWRISTFYTNNASFRILSAFENLRCFIAASSVLSFIIEIVSSPELK